MKAFAVATSPTYKKLGEPDYAQMYTILGLDIKAMPTMSEINRAYRKSALKVHPDKGGDKAEVCHLIPNLYQIFYHLMLV